MSVRGDNRWDKAVELREKFIDLTAKGILSVEGSRGIQVNLECLMRMPYMEGTSCSLIKRSSGDEFHAVLSREWGGVTFFTLLEQSQYTLYMGVGEERFRDWVLGPNIGSINH
jgi:hypothetical protein